TELDEAPLDVVARLREARRSDAAAFPIRRGKPRVVLRDAIGGRGNRARRDVFPIREKNIRVVLARRGRSIRRERERLSVGRENRKTIEDRRERDSLAPGA